MPSASIPMPQKAVLARDAERQIDEPEKDMLGSPGRGTSKREDEVSFLGKTLENLGVDNPENENPADVWSRFPKEIDFDAQSHATDEEIFALPCHLIVESELMKVAYKYSVQELLDRINSHQRPDPFDAFDLQERFPHAIAIMALDVHMDYQRVRQAFRRTFRDYHLLKEWRSDDIQRALDEWFKEEPEVPCYADGTW